MILKDGYFKKLGILTDNYVLLAHGGHKIWSEAYNEVSSLVARDSNSYVNLNYINYYPSVEYDMTTAVKSPVDSAKMLITNGSDNYLRKSNQAGIRYFVRVPWGFYSWDNTSSWGNTTGTNIATWNESDGGSIQFMKNNPSNGKLSVKVDGRFYINEGTYPVMGMNYNNNYWGVGGPDAQYNTWIRTTTSGFIPEESGGEWSGHSSLGTSTWYFGNIYSQYVNNIHFKGITINNSTSWSDNKYTKEIFGDTNNIDYKFSVIRTNAYAPIQVLDNYSSGISWKGADTYGAITNSYSTYYSSINTNNKQGKVRFLGGNNDNPVWYFTLCGTNTVSYNLDNMPIYVQQNTSDNINYPLIWSNENNTNSISSVGQLYKSYDNIVYNPYYRRIILKGNNNSNSNNSYMMKIIQGTDNGSGNYDAFIISSNDCPGFRISESDGTQLGLCAGDLHSTFISTHDFRFYTGATSNTSIYSGSSGKSRLRITNSGTYIDGNSTNVNHIYLTGYNNTSTSNTTQLVFGLDSSNHHIALSSNVNKLIINPSISSTTGQIELGVNGARTYFSSSGKFLIGTTNEIYKLEVGGDIRSTGFRHNAVNSDSYVLLAGGGYKALSDFLLKPSYWANIEVSTSSNTWTEPTFGRIYVQPHQGSWVSGMTTNPSIWYNNGNAIDANSYWAFLGMKSSSSHVINFGGLGNDIGFFGYYSGRTDNSYDWCFTVNMTNGVWTTSKDFYSDGHMYSYGFHHRNYNSYDYLLTSNGDARHINSLPYEYKYGVWIDLSGYSESYWHPVVTSLPTEGYKKIKVTVQLNSGTKPSWSTHSSGFTCNFEVYVTASGWGTTSSETIVLNNSYNFANANPVGFGQLSYSSQAVLYLRGGGKYYILTDWNTSWHIYNQSYTWTDGSNSQTAGPYTSNPGCFIGGLTKNWIYAHTYGNIITDDYLSIKDYTGSYHGRSNNISGYAGEIWFGGNFHIDSQNGQDLYLNHYSSNNIAMVTGGGNVGIGTSSPSYGLTLAVNKRLYIYGEENNSIYTEYHANSHISTNSPENYAAIRHGFVFQWYETYWKIGNVRGGSTNSAGFGIADQGGARLGLLVRPGSKTWIYYGIHTFASSQSWTNNPESSNNGISIKSIDGGNVMTPYIHFIQYNNSKAWRFATYNTGSGYGYDNNLILYQGYISGSNNNTLAEYIFRGQSYGSQGKSYIATCEGNSYNIVCLGIVCVYKNSDSNNTWYSNNISGLIDLNIKYQPKDQYFEYSGNPAYLQQALIVEVISKSYITDYTTKTTVNVCSAIGVVESTWWGNRKVIGRVEGSERNTAYNAIEIAVLNSINIGGYQTVSSSGKYLSITARRPYGDNDNDNIGLVQFDGLLETGNGSIASIRITIFGYMS